MCENLNAEIASGTISSVVEAVGYLSWTFYARRMRTNPSYYGAVSDSDEDVESALSAVVKETLSRLSTSGCVEYDEKDSAGRLTPSPLGIASCSFYLLHETPKQMQYGIRQCRIMVKGELESEKDLFKASAAFNRSERVDEISLAWLLHTLCNTHEFDELPVRHNEEALNEALSDDLSWGPDTQALLTGREGNHHPDTYADPHTKAFLLIQAYLEKARLPISDYVNDTKSVVENVPRLLAAMEYIASSDMNAAGSFELLSQFARTRQFFETRSLPGDNPLLQVGLPEPLVRSLASGAKGKNDAVREISQLRALSRGDASSLLNKVNRGEGGKGGVDSALDRLYEIPSVVVQEAKVLNEVNKRSGKCLGKVKLSLEIERALRKSTGRSRGEESLTILVGTLRQRMLLAKTSVRLSRSGKWHVTRDVPFDWDAANADGGEDGGKVVVRVLFNEVRGFDQEMLVSMR